MYRLILPLLSAAVLLGGLTSATAADRDWNKNQRATFRGDAAYHRQVQSVRDGQRGYTWRGGSDWGWRDGRYYGGRNFSWGWAGPRYYSGPVRHYSYSTPYYHSYVYRPPVYSYSYSALYVLLPPLYLHLQLRAMQVCGLPGHWVCLRLRHIAIHIAMRRTRLPSVSTGTTTTDTGSGITAGSGRIDVGGGQFCNHRPRPLWRRPRAVVVITSRSYGVEVF